MSDLESLFKQIGLSGFPGYTQTMLVLLDAQGALLEWNNAFDHLKSSLPSVTALQDFLTEASRSLYCVTLDSKVTRQVQLRLLAEAGGAELRCLFAPLPGGQTLFCAEPIHLPVDQQLAHLTDELLKARRALKIKDVELESVLAQADEVSHTDSLTFLPNRRRIIADLQRDVFSCDRYHKPLSIFMVDIDLFKRINDTYGHAAGDQVLRALSAEMVSSIRQIDKLGRYGGEEFLFILPSTAKKSAVRMAERLLDVVRALEINLEGEQVIRVTISIGIAQYHIGKESWEELLKRADQALYESKENGRDRWSVSN
ncbi:MAG TPA: GGDEF domain-containing protein [Anaerolineales bacterium]